MYCNNSIRKKNMWMWINELIKDYPCCVVLLICIRNVHNLLNKRGILYFNDELFNNEVNIMNINVSVVILQWNYDDEVKNNNVIYNSIKKKNQYKEEYY